MERSSGLEEAAHAVAEVVKTKAASNFPELESYANAILDDKFSYVKTKQASKTPKYDFHRRVSIQGNQLLGESETFSDIFSFKKEVNEVHVVNHAIRFGMTDSAHEFANNMDTDNVNCSSKSDQSFDNSFMAQEKSTCKRSSIFGSVKHVRNDYDDVTDRRVLAAPICDICIIHKGDDVPSGYYRISKTPRHKKADLNAGTGATKLYICIKKDLTGTAIPITGLAVIFPDRNEFVPPGSVMIRRNGLPCNINAGTIAERVFLCMQRDPMCNPITDIEVIFNTKDDTPKNFNLIDVTSTGLPANVNLRSGAIKVMLCYRQPARNLFCLLDRDREEKTSPGNHEKVVGDANRSGWMESVSGYIEEANASNTRRNPNRVVVDSNGEIRTDVKLQLLHPILMALYIRQGYAANVAMAELIELLRDTDFFAEDLKVDLSKQSYISHGNGEKVSLLDLTVEVIADRIEFCCEKQHDILLEFIKVLILKANGNMSQMTLQNIYRALFFLSSYYSTYHAWVTSGSIVPRLDNNEEIPAVIALQELLWSVVARVEDNLEDTGSAKAANASHINGFCLGNGLNLPETYKYEPLVSTKMRKYEETEIMMHAFVWECINNVIDTVETSKMAETAHILVAKQTSSPLHTYFWNPVTDLSEKLFESHHFRCCFTSLCAITQFASRNIRSTEAGVANSRDLGGKIIALDCLYEFCSSAGETVRASKVLGFHVRRLVVPCLLQNVAYAMTDHRVFAKLLRIITVLWKVWRQHVLVEFAMLCEQFVIPILQVSTRLSPEFQLTTLIEVASWLDQPFNLVEMFVNYDMDNRYLSHWNVFAHLMRAISTLVKRFGGTSAIRAIAGTGEGIGTSEVGMVALQEMTHVAKTLMDTAGHAHLMMADAGFRSKSLLQGAGWTEDDDDLDGNDLAVAATKLQVDVSGNGTMSRVTSSNSLSTTGAPRKGRGSTLIQTKRAHRQLVADIIAQADKIYQEKKSLPKVVKFLLAANFMQNTPQEIANFLRVYKSHFDPTGLGEFLGEGGVKSEEIEYWNQIRYRYARAVSFVELEIEPALRLFLTGCGFRLPGESQKIERFMEVFATTFWQDNQGTPCCPFRHRDTILVVSYSIIMLNTDLHKANTDNKKKHRRMNVDDFCRNLRGCDEGQDIDREYLSRIFNTINLNPIALDVSTVEVGGAEAKSKKKEESNDHAIAVKSVTAFNQDIHTNVRDSTDLLRSLSQFFFEFQVTGEQVNISLDLVSFMFESVWLHFHAITESLLSRLHDDDSVTFSAMDILSHSLVSCIFLDLKFERMQFLNSYVKFKILCDSEFATSSTSHGNVNNNSLRVNRTMSASSASANTSPGAASVSENGESTTPRGRRLSVTAHSGVDRDGQLELDPENEVWYEYIENATPENAMDVVSFVHKMMLDQKEAIREHGAYEIMKKVASKIERTSKICEMNTSFVREGYLTKVSHRNGHESSYCFFLFSDSLIYTRKSITGTFIIHATLSLADMELQDHVEDATMCTFGIKHPVKSFNLIAESVDVKYDWYYDLIKTIESCKAKREKQLQEISKIPQPRYQLVSTSPTDGMI